MTALVSFVLFCQGLGAGIGACMVVWGELAYFKAMHDGRIDRAERAHLDALARGLRWGMTLLLLASFALVVVAYAIQAPVQPVFVVAYWTLMLISLLIIYVSWALSRKRISFALGSALAFTAWWFLAYLTFDLLPPLSFGGMIFFFVVATAIFYALLHYARSLVRPRA